MNFFSWFKRNPSVEFIHKSPRIPNIGDYLCSPRHYYEFENPTGRVAVIGGGAFEDLGAKEAKRIRRNHNVMWAVGSSSPDDVPMDLRAIREAFDLAGTRDPASARDGISLLPCVSVHHPLNDIPPGTGRALLLNAAPRTSGPRISELMQRHAKQGDLIVADNSVSEAALLGMFGEVGSVFTNSYHFAYWSLLSGRVVSLIGYSTKFTSLLTLLGQDPSLVIRYEKGDSDGLERAIEKALSEPPQLRLNNAGQTKQEFRAANDAFAARLSEIGLFQSVRRLRTDHTTSRRTAT